MDFASYREFDATGLAGLVRAGEVSAAELVEVALGRLEQVNPKLGAVVHLQAEQARRQAERAIPQDAPLFGVPFLLKDLGYFEQGEPARMGCKLFADFIADHDSHYVTACKEAGLIILGRSASPPFGMSTDTASNLHGICRNPWDLSLSPGGSSGGAAAAVAAGIVPIAHATDAGGSIRIPAAHCGLFGLKPTRGRISYAPDAGEVHGGLATSHVVTRSVRDSALMLDLTSGYVPGDPYTAPKMHGSFLEALARPGPRLKIARMRLTHRGSEFHADNAAAIDHAARLCEGLGHIIEEADPHIDLVAARESYRLVFQVGIARLLNKRWAELGRQPSPDGLEQVIWQAWLNGSQASASAYCDAIAMFHGVGRKLAAFLQSYDVIVSATVAGPPPPAGWLDMDDAEAFAARGSAYSAVSPVDNMAGTPAMSLPLYWNEQDVPIGVHFTGSFGEEKTLLSLAHELEQARPWFHRIPSMELL